MPVGVLWVQYMTLKVYIHILHVTTVKSISIISFASHCFSPPLLLSSSPPLDKAVYSPCGDVTRPGSLWGGLKQVKGHGSICVCQRPTRSPQCPQQGVRQHNTQRTPPSPSVHCALLTALLNDRPGRVVKQTTRPPQRRQREKNICTMMLFGLEEWATAHMEDHLPLHHKF